MGIFDPKKSFLASNSYSIVDNLIQLYKHTISVNKQAINLSENKYLISQNVIKQMYKRM